MKKIIMPLFFVLLIIPFSSALTYLEDNAESTTGWSVLDAASTGVFSVDSVTFYEGTGSLKIVDSSGAGYMRQGKTFSTAPTSGIINASFYVRATDATNLAEWNLRRNTGTYASDVFAAIYFESENIYCRDNTASYDTGLTALDNTWYKVNIIYAFGGTNYSIYVNNALACANMGDYASITPTMISFQSSGTAGTNTAFMDDILIYNNTLVEVDKTLSVTAINNVTSASINAFNASLYYPNGTLFRYNTTTTGTIDFNMTGQILGLYTLNFISDDYLDLSTIINFTNNSLNYEFLTITAPNLNLTFYDEITKQLVENVSFELIFGGSAIENTTTTGNSFVELNDVGELEIIYNSDGYFLRKYFINITSETDEQLKLYLLNESATNVAEISYLITDQAGVNLQGAKISALRRYVVNDVAVFEVVEMSKSGISGDGAFHLEQLTPDYKFIVTYNDAVVLITSPNQLFKDSIILKATLGIPITTNLYALQSLSYDLDYNNYTYTLEWVDNNEVVDTVCLYVYRYLATGRTTTNSSCLSAGTGTIDLGIGGLLGDYEAVATVVIDGETYTLVNEHKKLSSSPESIGVEGIFWTAVLVAIAATVAVFSPVISIIFAVAVLIISSIIGFVSISQGSLIFLGCIAGFIIYSFRRGGA